MASTGDSIIKDDPAVVSGGKTIISVKAPKTKTLVEDDGTYKWTNNDAINVFGIDGTSCGQFTTYIEEPSISADFIGEVPDGVTPKYALYPYDETATCGSDGVIMTNIPTVQDGTITSALSYGTSEDGIDFFFNNASSVIRLDFNASDNIYGVSVKFEKAVAGVVGIDCSNGNILFATSKVVSVESATPLDGPVYLSIAPTDKRKITLTFTKIDDATAVKTVTVKEDFVAGTIKPLGNVRNLSFNAASLKEFAGKFVKVLDVWQATPNTVNKKGGHMIPADATITLGGVTYNKSNMYEVAVQGLMTLSNGGSLNDAIPEVHNYAWGTNVKDGPNASYNNDLFTESTVSLNFLRNYAYRQINFGSPKTAWANYCGYPSPNGTPQVSGYQNCALERHLLMMARFYKYLLDHDITSNILTACADVAIDAGLYEANFESATLLDFANEFSGILSVWESNMKDNKRKVPADATITVGGKSYNKSNMYEVAVKGLMSLVDGGSLYDAVPEVHGYSWGTSSTAVYTNDDFKNSDVSLNFLRNFASRQIDYADKNKAWANMCGYDGNPSKSGTPEVSGYYNACAIERHLLMMARFYKYLLDENLTYDIINKVGGYRFDSTLY